MTEQLRDFADKYKEIAKIDPQIDQAVVLINAAADIIEEAEAARKSRISLEKRRSNKAAKINASKKSS